MAWDKTGNRKSLRVKLRKQETNLGFDESQYFDGVTGQTGTGFTYNNIHWVPLTYGEGGTFAQQPVTGTTGFTERLSAFTGYTRDVLLDGNTQAFASIDWSAAYELANITLFLTTGDTNEYLKVKLYETTKPLTPSEYDGSGGTTKNTVQKLRVTVRYNYFLDYVFGYDDYEETISIGNSETTIQLSSDKPFWDQRTEPNTYFETAEIHSVVGLNDNDDVVPLEYRIIKSTLYYLKYP